MTMFLGQRKCVRSTAHHRPAVGGDPSVARRSTPIGALRSQWNAEAANARAKTVRVLRTGDRQDIQVRLPVGQSRDRQECDDRPVVGERIHAAGGHRGDPVEQLGADALRPGQLQVALAHDVERDRQPPEAEPVMPARTLTAVASEIRTCRLTRKTPVLDRSEAGQALDRVAEPDFRGRIEDGQQCSHEAAERADGKRPHHRRRRPSARPCFPAEEPRSVPRSDGQRLPASAKGNSRLSTSAGYPGRERSTTRSGSGRSSPTNTSRIGRDGGYDVWSRRGSLRLGLVGVSCAVPLSGRCRPRPSALQPEQAAGKHRQSPKGTGQGRGVRSSVPK